MYRVKRIVNLFYHTDTLAYRITKIVLQIDAILLLISRFLCYVT